MKKLFVCFVFFTGFFISCSSAPKPFPPGFSVGLLARSGDTYGAVYYLSEYFEGRGATVIVVDSDVEEKDYHKIRNNLGVDVLLVYNAYVVEKNYSHAKGSYSNNAGGAMQQFGDSMSSLGAAMASGLWLYANCTSFTSDGHVGSIVYKLARLD